MRIAVITPEYKNDYLTDTVIDGLLDLQTEDSTVEFCILNGYISKLPITPESVLPREQFIAFAREADLILFCWGKGNTNYALANEITHFEKTVFIDGSEIGKNGRFDSEIQKQILSGTYAGNGKVDKEMEGKCALYFRREKPYVGEILPLPFGIEKKYTKYYSEEVKKDIDFFCVFGQDEYPILRREVKQPLMDFCDKNGFNYFVDKTNQDNFYKILARSKVGISVGGGGFDTARFWEILGNNCILFTETIDVYQLDSGRLEYKRILQFKDINEFKAKLEDLGGYIKNKYDQSEMSEEYTKILSEHSSKARVLEIIQKAKERGII